MKATLTTIIMLAMSAGLHAKDPHFAKIVKIEPKLQPTPNYQAKGPDSKQFKARDWIEIEAEVKVYTSDPSGYIPELKANWYAVVKDKVRKRAGGKEWPVMLMGESTYKNVPVKDGTIYLSAYVEPRTLERYLGDGHFRESDFKAFALTLSGEGLNVDEETGKGPFMSTDDKGSKWWEDWNDRDYLAEGIAPKSKTPFVMMWIDRYPAEKEAE